MNFNSAAQEKAYELAIKRKYKAIAFDIDGTLTELSRFTIPASLCGVLNALDKNIPLAFCTGRPLSYIQSKLKHVCDDAPYPDAERKRWYILAENGGAGYAYKAAKRVYQSFFEVPWPDKVITKDALEAFIKDKLGWHVKILIRDHSLVVRFNDWLYFFPKLVRIASRRTAKTLKHLLEEMSIAKDFHIQDSGIGHLIIPQNSGKGKAIVHWAKHLKIPVSDILVIGDQPLPGENDEELLNGNYGTAFTVGSVTHKKYPLPVLDERRKRVKGPKGTETLLKQLFN